MAIELTIIQLVGLYFPTAQNKPQLTRSWSFWTSALALSWTGCPFMLLPLHRLHCNIKLRSMKVISGTPELCSNNPST